MSYETLDGDHHTLAFDFGMLLPPFGGVPLKAYDRDGDDITDQIFAPSGFMKVDADYTPKPFEEWSGADWPQTYLAPGYPNIFAVGIAFAPPHQISRPRKSPNGTVIAPSPPRTGMPCGIMGKTAALTSPTASSGSRVAGAHRLDGEHGRRLCRLGGSRTRDGSAAAMTMMPVVPDYSRFATGRDLKGTTGEVGLGGHWVKLMLHHLFIYKAKARPAGT